MATHAPKLQQNYAVPTISRVGASRPLHWLKEGWDDFLSHPVPSVMYGLIVAIVSWMILKLAAPHPYLVSAAVSAFLLIAPLLTAGIYELTREHEQGVKATFMESLRGLRRTFGSIADYGVVLVIMAALWERAGAILFALSYGGEMHSVEGFVHEIFFSGNYVWVMLSWMIGGLALCAFVFSLTVIGMPMVIDRNIDVITAMIASFKATLSNIPAMLVWAAIIVAFCGSGLAVVMINIFMTHHLMLGAPLIVSAPLAIAIPLLGHTTWCAYKDLVH
jgi:uncharacterized membrane protein